MNLTYIIGVVAAVAVMLFGMVSKIDPTVGLQITFGNLKNFLDPASILITIGCTFAIVVASFPASKLKAMPKHFGILLNTKRFNPRQYIEQLVELAQVARKNGLLSLEEKAGEQTDPFFKQAIMLIVDANDPDRVRAILENDIECMSARHEDAAGMYDKASSIAPAFGMVGTLVGLINMLKGMSLDSGGASSLGSDMGTALITTLYGCILAHMLFGPIATILRNRDSEEVLCKMIIVEGIMSIQSGENPKFLEEKLMTYMAQKQRGNDGGGGKKGKGKKNEEE
ncbi:motility protein A [Pseudoflavonifractor sp. 524-17]|uniref:motility protein A n=1 Tax=Pseudoflavonifractor sp. 524-17 TaxID=2304577 RepID=UPI0013798FEF|nr:MotA/TolQ/ExbB proton channel family protein [Pseudoflavonifractor sp. 524-17]NCE66049.1 motility protein A [Pseudoflavonifractor sp. 524-17]